VYAGRSIKPNSNTPGKLTGMDPPLSGPRGSLAGSGETMSWYLMVWKRYADFSGRSRRKELWMFTLIQSLILIVFYAVAVAGLRSPVLATSAGMLTMIYVLAAMIPNLAVSIRRLHDIGKSGWWLLISLIPLAGLVILVFYCLDSDPADNEYGPSPKPGPATILG
jgi:uncharacterized membrane protein YhaH (DUF805 family)